MKAEDIFSNENNKQKLRNQQLINFESQKLTQTRIFFQNKMERERNPAKDIYYY